MNKNFMSLEEVRSKLGISSSLMYKLSQRNALPKYRPMGRKIYFLEEEVEAFMLKNRIPSINELEATIDLQSLKMGGKLI